jgi:hypothetical protein
MSAGDRLPPFDAGTRARGEVHSASVVDVTYEELTPAPGASGPRWRGVGGGSGQSSRVESDPWDQEDESDTLVMEPSHLAEGLRPPESSRSLSDDADAEGTETTALERTVVSASPVPERTVVAPAPLERASIPAGSSAPAPALAPAPESERTSPVVDHPAMRLAGVDRTTAERRLAERSPLENPAVQRVTVDRATSERGLAERVALRRASVDRATGERVPVEGSAVERPALHRAVVDRATGERALADGVAVNRATVDRTGGRGPMARPAMHRATVERASGAVDRSTENRALSDRAPVLERTSPRTLTFPLPLVRTGAEATAGNQSFGSSPAAGSGEGQVLMRGQSGSSSRGVQSPAAATAQPPAHSAKSAPGADANDAELPDELLEDVEDDIVEQLREKLIYALERARKAEARAAAIEQRAAETPGSPIDVERQREQMVEFLERVRAGEARAMSAERKVAQLEGESSSTLARLTTELVEAQDAVESLTEQLMNAAHNASRQDLPSGELAERLARAEEDARLARSEREQVVRAAGRARQRLIVGFGLSLVAVLAAGGVAYAALQAPMQQRLAAERASRSAAQQQAQALGLQRASDEAQRQQLTAQVEELESQLTTARSAVQEPAALAPTVRGSHTAAISGSAGTVDGDDGAKHRRWHRHSDDDGNDDANATTTRRAAHSDGSDETRSAKRSHGDGSAGDEPRWKRANHASASNAGDEPRWKRGNHADHADGDETRASRRAAHGDPGGDEVRPNKHVESDEAPAKKSAPKSDDDNGSNDPLDGL